MKSKLILALVLFSVFLSGCSEVETGRITKCRICGKEISRDVRLVKVPFWQKGKIIVSEDYCKVCGNERVPYMVHVHCERCGKEYDSYKEYAPRKENQKDKTITEGFCSTGCERWGKVEKGVDKASETTGDFIGRVGKGIFKGIKKHTE